MKLFFFILSYCLCIYGHAQIRDSSYIRTHAIPITDRQNLTDSVYNVLKTYKIILVGETHGTTEPAEFVEGIANAFLRNDRDIIIGMEISAESMHPYIPTCHPDSLARTKFFTQSVKWGDGRASVAWAHLLLTFSDRHVRFIFFDRTASQYKNGASDRDSAMYENINGALRENPHAVFICICGNFHNMLKEYNQMIPMAWYLTHAVDTELKDTNQLISFCHVADMGTYNANTSDGKTEGPTGLQVHENTISVSGTFGTSVGYDNYLLIGDGYDGYSGIVYSRKEHASLLWIPAKY